MSRDDASSRVLYFSYQCHLLSQKSTRRRTGSGPLLQDPFIRTAGMAFDPSNEKSWESPSVSIEPALSRTSLTKPPLNRSQSLLSWTWLTYVQVLALNSICLGSPKLGHQSRGGSVSLISCARTPKPRRCQDVASLSSEVRMSRPLSRRSRRGGTGLTMEVQGGGTNLVQNVSKWTSLASLPRPPSHSLHPQGRYIEQSYDRIQNKKPIPILVISFMIKIISSSIEYPQCEDMPVPELSLTGFFKFVSISIKYVFQHKLLKPSK